MALFQMRDYTVKREGLGAVVTTMQRQYGPCNSAKNLVWMLRLMILQMYDEGVKSLLLIQWNFLGKINGDSQAHLK